MFGGYPLFHQEDRLIHEWIDGFFCGGGAGNNENPDKENFFINFKKRNFSERFFREPNFSFFPYLISWFGTPLPSVKDFPFVLLLRWFGTIFGKLPKKLISPTNPKNTPKSRNEKWKENLEHATHIIYPIFSFFHFEIRNKMRIETCGQEMDGDNVGGGETKTKFIFITMKWRNIFLEI